MLTLHQIIQLIASSKPCAALETDMAGHRRYIVASSELKGIVDGLGVSCVHKFATLKGVQWSFASWMNGVTESLVKSIKRSLNTAIGDQVLSFSELQTTMFECAQLVNQRPIWRHPTEPEDGSYLCLNDLILGRSTSQIPQGPFQPRTSMSKRFQFIQSLTDAFWKKWCRDYFPNLLIRSKWHVLQRAIKVGDIVLIKDVNALRGRWRTGRVTRTYPSKDHEIRKVSVLCKAFKNTVKGEKEKVEKLIETERAVHNLVVLIAAEETDSDNE